MGAAMRILKEPSQSMLHSSRVNLASDDFHCLRCASWSTCVSAMAKARGEIAASKRDGSAARSLPPDTVCSVARPAFEVMAMTVRPLLPLES